MATSHRRALLSAPPEARRAPSGLKARARTAFSCPLRGSPRLRAGVPELDLAVPSGGGEDVAGGAEGDRLYLTSWPEEKVPKLEEKARCWSISPLASRRDLASQEAAPRASRETTAPRRRAVSGRTLSWVTAGPATPLSSAREAC